MTLISRTGFIPDRKLRLVAPSLRSCQEITLVVPVLNNPIGINRLLEALKATHPKAALPREILIVDNGSDEPLRPKDYGLPVRVLHCAKRGPANARNMGVAEAFTEWVAFIDSDCVPCEGMLSGYLNATPGSLGYAGMVKALDSDPVSKYYDDQEILIPPEVSGGEDHGRPDYLVTANCLVWKPAFMKAGCFDGSISIAGGEDVALGFKLREIGQLDYATESSCMHEFSSEVADFAGRFIRYGQGNRLVAERFGLDLEPRPFQPVAPGYFNDMLAQIQFECMRHGYNRTENLTTTAP